VRSIRLLTLAVVATLGIISVPTANAFCVYCDSTGCHVTSSGCGSGGAAAFTGTSFINCFGCGTSNGNASLNIVGASASGGPINGAANATFTVNEPAATCPVQGSAVGSTTGALAVNFVWTRLGATAVITTSGDIGGAGVAAFVVVGNPCGGPVTATLAGAIAGV
jgi:hypothetical protein